MDGDPVRRVEAAARWEELSQARSRALRGLAERMRREPRLTVLFCGGRGTGRRPAAETLAAHLGLELYRVDLSGAMSRFIGETGTHLDRLFAAAREAGAILFFDEADALFGKREGVEDAHERYAEVEVGYLLQRLEEHDGPAILAVGGSDRQEAGAPFRIDVVLSFLGGAEGGDDDD